MPAFAPGGQGTLDIGENTFTRTGTWADGLKEYATAKARTAFALERSRSAQKRVTAAEKYASDRAFDPVLGRWRDDGIEREEQDAEQSGYKATVSRGWDRSLKAGEAYNIVSHNGSRRPDPETHRPEAIGPLSHQALAKSYGFPTTTKIHKFVQPVDIISGRDRTHLFPGGVVARPIQRDGEVRAAGLEADNASAVHLRNPRGDPKPSRPGRYRVEARTFNVVSNRLGSQVVEGEHETLFRAEEEAVQASRAAADARKLATMTGMWQSRPKFNPVKTTYVDPSLEAQKCQEEAEASHGHMVKALARKPATYRRGASAAQNIINFATVSAEEKDRLDALERAKLQAKAALRERMQDRATARRTLSEKTGRMQSELRMTGEQNTRDFNILTNAGQAPVELKSSRPKASFFF